MHCSLAASWPPQEPRGGWRPRACKECRCKGWGRIDWQVCPLKNCSQMAQASAPAWAAPALVLRELPPRAQPRGWGATLERLQQPTLIVMGTPASSPPGAGTSPGATSTAQMLRAPPSGYHKSNTFLAALQRRSRGSRGIRGSRGSSNVGHRWDSVLARNFGHTVRLARACMPRCEHLCAGKPAAHPHCRPAKKPRALQLSRPIGLNCFLPASS